MINPIKIAAEAGSKVRIQLTPKQIAEIPQVAKLIENIENPRVMLGINGRGAEGSMYGIKVFAKGSKEPVAYAAGRVDYRDAQPLLQARFQVKANTGGGDAVKGRVMLDTNHKLDLNDLDELAVSNKKGEFSVKAKGSGVDAEATGNISKIDEILSFIKPGSEKGFQGVITSLSEKTTKITKDMQELLQNFNPYKPAKTAKKVSEKASKKATQIMPEEAEKTLRKMMAEDNLKKVKDELNSINRQLIEIQETDFNKMIKEGKVNEAKQLFAKKEQLQDVQMKYEKEFEYLKSQI